MPTVAVVDLGSNSTRLLLCDVQDGRVVAEHDRRSVVTRLGQGVDASGELAEEAVGRVMTTLDDFAPALERADLRIAVLTSAVRDASNGAAFTATVAERHGLDARTLTGEEEARLTFLGATSERESADPVLVIDIGGGSTELAIGQRGWIDAHVSLQMGVVRLTERHLHDDPPTPEQLRATAADARATLEASRPRRTVREVIAVAGTATQLASIDGAVRGEEPPLVHGRTLTLARIEELLARLAQAPLEQRRETPGLDPTRAPTIVAGAVLLAETLRVFSLREVTVSEYDILRGAALDAARRA